MLPRAITSDEHTRIQLDGQWVEVLACIPTPATLYTARVNGAPSGTDKLAQITFDGGSGTLADVLPGMTLWVGTSAGAFDRGQARVRKNPTSTIFYIGTESEIDVHDNDYLTVVDEFGLWQKRVKIDSGTIYMDEDVAYSGQNAAPLPVVVMGGPAVLELIAPTVTAEFDATNSWVPGASGNTYAWAAPGADSHSSTSSATFTATYSAAGRYRVSCTVTINSVSNTRYEYVQVFDTDNPSTTQFQVRSISASKSQGGYSWQMTLFAEADLATIRDRAQVILFTRDHYGADGQISTGYAAGRENILATGWISGESITWSPEQSSVTFTVDGAQAWLARITAYPQGLDDVTTTPALWTEYNTLTMTAFLWHLLTWRSTVAQAVDCLVEISTTRIIEMSAAATSLWEQIQVTAGQRLLAPPCTDHLSRLFILIDSQYRSDRSGVAEVMTLAKADWRPPITLNRVIVPPVGMVDSSGFAWDGTNATALFSLSPGRVWKRYGNVKSVQALLLADQDQANTLCGLIAGQANNEYPQVTVQLAGNNRFLDIAPDSYALLTLAAADTPRGVSFTNKRFVPRSISWSYDAASGGLLPSVTLEGETFAQLAVTGDAPATEPIAPPNPPPTETCPTGYHWDGDLETCVPNGGGGGIGDQNTVLIATDTDFAMTHNFLSGSPNWVNLRNITLSGTIVSWCLSSFDPVNVAFVCTTSKVYIVSSLQGTPVWTEILDKSDFSVSFGGDPLTIDALDFVASPITDVTRLWVGATGHNAHISVCANFGLMTVDIVGLTGSLLAQLGAVGGASGIGLVGPLVRRIIPDFTDATLAYAAVKYGNPQAAFVTLNYDGTGTLVNTVAKFFGAGSLGADMDADYPSGAQTMYYNALITDNHIFQSTDNGGTWTDIKDVSISGAALLGVRGNRIVINIATSDTDDVLFAFPPGDTAANTTFYRTTDGGTNIDLVYTGAYGNSAGVHAMGRWPYDPNVVFFLGDAGPYYTADMFASAPLSKLGDWASAVAAWANGINIVPIWLAL